MDFINGFFSNLSSKYTSTLIAFMTGVVFAKFRWHKGPGLALLIGVGIAALVALIASLFEFWLPQTLTININLNTVLTIALLGAFFYVSLAAKIPGIDSGSDAN
ncbi:hypothetical protein Klosneuvirus_5_105 [Klosneuvirus KNV1]|uniref:Uncharacterized protein n=1 Tax=Klosneuvirus KNV1 TaxID=1977640 RepID=A0A1V0SL16_9VIRU|nr:hypothetical protein Klosneuvirus_5_105 [Klosneuvirus KNV1]